MTSPDKFRSAESLFNQLLDIPADERGAALERLAGDDSELCDMVARMLAHEESEDDVSLLGDVLTSTDVFDDLAAGQRIGAYVIERKLGEGGMGVVYEARQEKPVERRAALKLIKPGMDSNQILARFESERRLLARMQHPNIAMLYDAGRSESGRPYFAMEFVDGLSIVKYCDEHGLAIRERLRLLLQVCNGVQHAHQKGVIHRDLKPGNITVYSGTKGPRAKIIDFGIAKLTDPASGDSMTRLGQVVGTPEYMSPEQLLPDETDIDTRTDVYALGMILFELLAGTLPASNSVDGANRKPSDALVSESDAATSAANRGTSVAKLRRTLTGDLDWIVMRATHGDRERRYSSAAELTQDICRYLDGDPVLAGPDSAWYRVRKFARRNRGLAAAAAVAVVSLAAATVTSTYFAIDAAQARDEAERETEVARAVNSFLNQDILAQGNPYQNSDRELTLREAIDRAAAALKDRFEDQPEVKAAIFMTLGSTYEGLGLAPKALGAYESAYLALDAANIRTNNYFGALLSLAGQQANSGQYDVAAENLDKVINASPQELDTDHLYRLQAMNTLAYFHDIRGDDESATAMYQDALDAHRRKFGLEDRETLTVMNNLGLIHAETGDLEQARVLLDDVARIREQVLGADDPDTVVSMYSLGYILTELGEYEDAEAVLLSSVETGRRVYGEDSPVYVYGFRLLADLYRKQQRFGDAERLYREALNGHRASMGTTHARTLGIQVRLAGLLAEQERYDEAIPLFEEVIGHRTNSLGLENTVTLGSIATLINVLDDSGRCAQAGEWSDRALSAAQAVFESGNETRAVFEARDATCP